MKIKFLEGEFGVSIDLEPETPAEVAQLLRYVKNAKAIKPDVRLYFGTDQPSMSIWLKKLPPKSQRKSIANP